MIIQTVLDFIRDLLVNFLVGVAQLWPANSVDAVLTNISIPSSYVGAFLAVTYTPFIWGVCLTLLASYAALFVGTGIIKAIAGRIGG